MTKLEQWYVAHTELAASCYMLYRRVVFVRCAFTSSTVWYFRRCTTRHGATGMRRTWSCYIQQKLTVHGAFLLLVT